MLVLVRLLSWLIVLGVTGGPEHRVSGSGDRIPLDEPPPVVPVLHSQFCKTLEKCPDTDSLKEHRQYCFEPPPRGHVYHCAATDFNGIVEFFYRKFPCRKGCYGIPEVLGYVVEMSCKKCPEDRFNPELRWSPENMDQCRTHYHKALDEHAIEYVPGNSSAPAVSYCNYTDNWASANEEMFCRESYQPCNCVYRGDFCKRLELLPDSSCEPWCDGQRLPKNNFRCTQVELPHTQRSSQITGSNKPTQIASTSRISPGRAPVTDEPTDKVSGVHPKTNDLFPRLIAGIILGCVVIVFLGSLIYNLIARRTSDKNDGKCYK